MPSLSIWELLIVFGIIVILFGGSRLASVGKALGEAIANFKKGIQSVNEPESRVETPRVYSLSSRTAAEEAPEVVERVEIQKRS